MMFMMWYAAQQQLKKIDIASNNGISIADDNDDRYTSTMTIYYADDTMTRLMKLQGIIVCWWKDIAIFNNQPRGSS